MFVVYECLLCMNVAFVAINVCCNQCLLRMNVHCVRMLSLLQPIFVVISICCV